MLEFQTSYSIADVISLLLLVAAVVGIFLSLKETRETAKTEKAVFFKDLYTTMFADPNIRDAYYQIEYEEFKYDADFHGSNNERLIDRLLSFVDLVCDLHAQGILTEHEMSFFKYQLLQIYKNRNVRVYLSFLEDFYAKSGANTKPFASFTRYCEKVLNKSR